MSKILIVGGAGYVGSACCAWLHDHGHEVWVLDDLSTGHEKLVLPELRDRFVHARAGDREKVLPLLKKGRFDCVMHFAAKSLVAESVEKPQIYFENNVEQTRALLEMILEAGTTRFVFSSTCAVFGDPGTKKIDEKLPRNPRNPYGITKLKVEEMLENFGRTRGLRSLALRYFNVAGSEPGFRVGELHEPETHLIPCVLNAAADGRSVEIFGTDYPTGDGTAIRDYIHVWDLAAAHAVALDRVLQSAGGGFEGFNLGSEKGYSVRDVIQECEKAVGRPLQVIEKARRAGDLPSLVADSTLAKKELGFKPRETLATMVRSAWEWRRKQERGTKKRAVFLDRDGTINEDPGYLREPSQMKLFSGVGEALARLQKEGYRLIVISNQSGVGRGLIDPKVMPKIHQKLDELLKPSSAKIDHYELCLHKPEEECDCRKPKPKLILDAAEKLGIDVSASFVVGDKITDLLAGRAAGCRAVALVRTGEGASAESRLKAGDADFVGDSLNAVADWILRQET